MTATLPTSSEFKRRVLSLYYGIWLPAPAVLLGSLFSLLDLTDAGWTFLVSLTIGFAILAAAVSTQRQLTSIAPLISEPSSTEIRATRM